MFFFIMLGAVFFFASAQVSDFENFGLHAGQYLNGSDMSGGFHSGAAFYQNTYNPDYFYWSGFAVSAVNDTVTSGYANQYASFAGRGYLSNTYAVGYYSGALVADTPAVIEGLYITNATYAALSMLHGDAYAKKFGGADGNDPDWFKVIFTGYDDAENITGAVEFFLADYRFENNDSDYVVKDWIWLDLTTLGRVKRVSFYLASTDTSEYGLNTPAYFCIDNITFDSGSKIRKSHNDLSWLQVFNHQIISQIPINQYFIYNTEGRIVRHGKNVQQITFSEFSHGLAIIRLKTSKGEFTIKTIVD